MTPAPTMIASGFWTMLGLCLKLAVIARLGLDQQSSYNSRLEHSPYNDEWSSSTMIM